MKSAFIAFITAYPLPIPMAKVHKSVGIGSAAHCNDDDDVNVNLFDKSEKFVTISTFVQVLQYIWPSTRVLKAKYWSPDGEVLEFCGVWWISPKDVIPTERSDEGSLIHQPSSINRSLAVLLSSSLQHSLTAPLPTYL